MAVLDNHSWQYAQAGKTLIRLSGGVFSIINVFCLSIILLFLVKYKKIEEYKSRLVYNSNVCSGK